MKSDEFCVSKTAALKEKLGLLEHSQKSFTDLTVKGTQFNPQVTVECDAGSYHATTMFLMDHYTHRNIQGTRNSVPRVSTTICVIKDRNKADYTVNFYHTTLTMLANGPGAVTSFIDHLKLATESGITLGAEQGNGDFIDTGSRSGLHDDTDLVFTPRPLSLTEEPSPCQNCKELRGELDDALNCTRELQARVLKLESEHGVRIHELEASVEKLVLSSTCSAPSDTSLSHKASPNAALRVHTGDTVPVQSYRAAAMADPGRSRSAPKSRVEGSRPTTATKTWAPERCFAITEYTDKESAQTLAGVRTAISKHIPILKIEAVHRPRSSKLIVQT